MLSTYFNKPLVPWLVSIVLAIIVILQYSLNNCEKPILTKTAITLYKLKQCEQELSAALRKAKKCEIISKSVKSEPKVESWKIPSNRNLKRDVEIDTTLDDFQKRVSIIVSGFQSKIECFTKQIAFLKLEFPKSEIFVHGKSEAESLSKRYSNVHFYTSRWTEGHALNVMMKNVKTEFVLYLSDGAIPSMYDSPHSLGWLLRAMIKVPEVDVIGGSYLSYNSSLKYSQLEIPCYRTKMCYWTFYQHFQYKYSVGDMMICEETSSSFLARVSSLNRLGKFDEFLTSKVTTDYFYRAKGRSILGLMPEIYFHIEKICSKTLPSPKKQAIQEQSFMDKYSLTRLTDSYGKEINYPFGERSSNSVLRVYSKFSYKIHGGFNYPQATETLKYFVSFFDDFFNEQNITYAIVAGVALGGIKSRNVLPWDTGDIDTGTYGIPWQQVLSKLEQFIKKRKANIKLSHAPFSDGPSHVHSISGYYLFNLHNDIYSREYVPTPSDDQLMYIFIHDRYIPVFRAIFRYFREDVYGINYLQMQNSRGNLKCSVSGHHACVPFEFSKGGGYWSDYYCHW